MFYRYSRDFEVFSQIEVDHLVCPLTNEKEKMSLVLYKMTTETPFIKRTAKKPSGVFYKAERQEPIPVRIWTLEMELFFEKERENIEFPKNLKMTVFGKIWIGIFVILFVAIGSMGIFEGVIKNKQYEGVSEEYYALPQAGDRYFGNVSYFRSNGGYFNGYAWAKVEGFNPIDSTATISIGKDVSSEYKKSSEMNNEDFGESIIAKYSVEYSSEGKPQGVVFKGTEASFFPWKPISGDKVENFKLKADH